jgi:hypothetical protein
MTTPSSVRTVRILLAHNDCSASFKASMNCMVLLSVQELFRFSAPPAVIPSLPGKSRSAQRGNKRSSQFTQFPPFLWTHRHPLRPLSAAEKQPYSRRFHLCLIRKEAPAGSAALAQSEKTIQNSHYPETFGSRRA